MQEVNEPKEVTEEVAKKVRKKRGIDSRVAAQVSPNVAGDFKFKDKWFVSSRDTFLSGWGESEGKDNILILVCDTSEEAQIVRDNMLARTDQDKVSNVVGVKPYFNPRTCFVQVKTKEDMPRWYEEGAFKK